MTTLPTAADYTFDALPNVQYQHTAQSKEQRLKVLRKFENLILRKDRLDLLEKLPSNVANPVSEETIMEAVIETQDQFRNGTYHIFMQRICREKSPDKTKFVNVVIPFVFFPKARAPFLDLMIILGDAKDTKHIAEEHVKKAWVYGTPILGEGVLSNRDNEVWAEQRKQLTEAFLPHMILGNIFKISRNRANYAVDNRLAEQIAAGKIDGNGVEVGEFYMYEAMAQLQLALLGENTEDMDGYNKELRDAFAHSIQPRDANGDLIEEDRFDELYSEFKKYRKVIHNYANGALQRGRDHVADGPLMNRLTDLCPFGKPDARIQRDSACTFLFAGHDTTANLMTHFTFEMARHPEYQRRLQAEIDSMFSKAEAENRLIEYDDLQSMIFMKHCMNETLRIWPSVPNGTWRELEHDDQITAADGSKLNIAQGFQCSVPTWLLHHNESLWGPDVFRFNPDREWTSEEDWGGKGLLGVNPASDRYCPFTYRPRDCIGRNFAQMEARVILSHVFRKYNADLAPKTAGHTPLEFGKNLGTFGPGNGLFINFTRRSNVAANM